MLVEAHVDVKRYLVATDPSYQAALSPGSVVTLQAQGGPLSPDEIRVVEQRPDWDVAVALRRADDGAKRAGAVVADLDHLDRGAPRGAGSCSMTRPNVLLITLDQYRGDVLSCAGHPVVRTPNLDTLAANGVRFANHFAQAAPCAPGSGAALYTGTYQMTNRVVGNGTPLDDRFDNVARMAKRAGYRPTLFGYTDQGVDPRLVTDADDPRLSDYEGVLPGFEVGLDLPGSVAAVAGMARRSWTPSPRRRTAWSPSHTGLPSCHGRRRSSPTISSAGSTDRRACGSPTRRA